jgi:NAD(P)-dependent dehydrogenase (short-subunit alcohol dehydrogenase family)
VAEVPGVGDPPGQVRVIHRGQVAALVSEVTLPGRLGSPEDLWAHMQILDATAASSYMTGQVLIIDGGWTAV